MDTIFALASGRVKAGVSVIRLSGPRAFAVAAELAGPLPEPRRAAVRKLRGADRQVIDEALILCFRAGASFTGEDVVELHVHGSLAVVAAVTRELGRFDGVRMAEAGEFSRRALMNDRLDLAQIEGLADLIDAETEAQRQQALRLFSGDLGRKVEQWRSSLVRAAALIEATIDFADEDVPENVMPEVAAILEATIGQFQRELVGAKTAERIRDGFEVAIVGRPNVGKSTLLNALAGREAAITSEHAGTTRDVIEVRMDIHGLPVTVLDTAGLRDTTDPVEKVGVRRATERARDADLRVFLLEDENEAPRLQVLQDDIIVLGKADLRGAGQEDGVSGRTGQGVDALVNRISTILNRRASGASTMTRARHQKALRHALGALESARLRIEKGEGIHELVAADLRGAIGALEVLIGRVGVEDYLGEIFASFCIGK